MLNFFLQWHPYFVLSAFIFFFILLSNPIYNIFTFMLVCIQSFIFLSLLTKQYFFVLILFIIYLGAIAVLFLFVVLVIGNSIFETQNKNSSISEFSVFSFTGVLYFIFYIFFYTFFITLSGNFYIWIINFENSLDLLLYKQYLLYMKELNYFFYNTFRDITLESFLYTENKAVQNFFFNQNNNIFITDNFELFYYKFINTFCKSEFFNFVNENNLQKIDFWCANLFLKDSPILYLCAIILFLSTIGVISLVVSRK